MTGIRRALLLTGLTLAVTVGAAIPASATFADSVALTTSLTTSTVGPPTNLEVKNVSCSSSYSALVEWRRSATARGTTGYVVTAHFADGSSSVMARTDASTVEVQVRATQAELARSPRLSVTTLTSYGWTAQSERTGVLTC